MAKPAAPVAELVRLAWPVFISQISVMVNGLIDTAMAGRLSTVDLAAVGIGASIHVTVLMSLMGVLLALPALVAQLHGAGERARIGREVHQGIWIALPLALVTILLLCFPGLFIAFAGLQPAVEAKVRTYLAASACGVPAVFAFRIFSGLTMGIGRPRPVMMLNLFALALKVPLNAVFMFGLLGAPALGASGCAVATAIDNWLLALLAWIWCLRQSDYAAFGLRRFSAPDLPAMVAFLRLGIPIGLTFLADVTAFTFMALFIARLGPATSAAHQIAANLSVLAFMLPLALGNATAVLAGQALGAGKPERARQVCMQGIVLSMGIALCVSLGCWIGAPLIAALYTPDAQVRALAVPLIVLVGFYHLADALQAVAVNALRGYRKTTVPMAIYTLSLWGVGLGGGYLLGLTDTLGPPRGAAGFWLAGIVGLGLAGSLVAVYLESVSRKAFLQNEGGF